MAQHNETGKQGEQLAIDYLVNKGYNILDINWVYNHKEIDIIAKNKGIIIFTEVKTRTTLAFELPKEAVTKGKMKNIVKTADAYLQQKGIDLPARFDIISVLAGDTYKVLEHIEDAFKPNELL